MMAEIHVHQFHAVEVDGPPSKFGMGYCRHPGVKCAIGDSRWSCLKCDKLPLVSSLLGQRQLEPKTAHLKVKNIL